MREAVKELAARVSLYVSLFVGKCWQSRCWHVAGKVSLALITPTSTPNSRLNSRTYLVFVLAKCNRCAMPLWFHWFSVPTEMICPFGFNRRHGCRYRDHIMTMARSQPDHNFCRRTPAPASGLDHDYGQITTSVVLLGVQITDVYRDYLGGRRRRQVPAPGLDHDYGQIMARSQPL